MYMYMYMYMSRIKSMNVSPFSPVMYILTKLFNVDSLIRFFPTTKASPLSTLWKVQRGPWIIRKAGRRKIAVGKVSVQSIVEARKKLLLLDKLSQQHLHQHRHLHLQLRRLLQTSWIVIHMDPILIVVAKNQQILQCVQKFLRKVKYIFSQLNMDKS